MKTGRKEGLPTEVRELVERIEEWRRTRAKRTVMPEELWEAATQAGRKYRVYRVARALHVNYESLKSRVLRGTGIGASAGTGVSAGFVELRAAGPSVAAATRPWVTELELTDGAGRTLRLRLDGVGAGEVVGLAERLWRGMP
ncbi:MAG: hypothetical protein FJ109_11055 [Deltaproteobacteria bacterium]|nr:hypothetical protein [Deltaproteobacteria bacterium]